MESDTEYQAYLKIVKNDKRFRIAAFLLHVVVLAAVLLSLLVVANNQKNLVAVAQKDGRTRTEENRRYITCLLILPLEMRDPRGQKYCYDRSDLPGGRRASEFTPIEVDAADAATAKAPVVTQDRQGQISSVVSSSCTDTTASCLSEQPKYSQQPR